MEWLDLDDLEDDLLPTGISSLAVSAGPSIGTQSPTRGSTFERFDGDDDDDCKGLAQNEGKLLDLKQTGTALSPELAMPFDLSMLNQDMSSSSDSLLLMNRILDPSFTFDNGADLGDEEILCNITLPDQITSDSLLSVIPEVTGRASMAESFCVGRSPNTSPVKSSRAEIAESTSLTFSALDTPNKLKIGREGSGNTNNDRPESPLAEAQRALESMKQKLEAFRMESTSNFNSPSRISRPVSVISLSKDSDQDIHEPLLSSKSPETSVPSSPAIAITTAPASPIRGQLPRSSLPSNASPIGRALELKDIEMGMHLKHMVPGIIETKRFDIGTVSPAKPFASENLKDTDSQFSSSTTSAYTTTSVAGSGSNLCRKPSRLRSPSKNKSAFKPVSIGLDVSRESSPRKPHGELFGDIQPDTAPFLSSFTDQISLIQEQEMSRKSDESSKNQPIKEQYRPVLSAAKPVSQQKISSDDNFYSPSHAQIRPPPPQHKVQSTSLPMLSRSKSILVPFTAEKERTLAPSVEEPQKSNATTQSPLRRSNTKIPMPKSRARMMKNDVVPSSIPAPSFSKTPVPALSLAAKMNPFRFARKHVSEENLPSAEKKFPSVNDSLSPRALLGKYKK